MNKESISFNRRGLLGGLVAIVPQQSVGSRDNDIQYCADRLAQALASKHGGSWRIYLDPAGIIVTVIKEFSAQT